MNKSYKLILNRHLGVFQVAPETARSAGKGSGTIGAGARLRPMAQAVLLTLLGSSSLAMAAPGSCTLTGSGTLSNTCQGDSGLSAPGASNSPGGNGTAAATGSGYDYSSDATLVGGAGGNGGNSEVGVGGAGGAGGTGLSGAGRFVNNGSISGGAGGRGGNSDSGMTDAGGNGGHGGVGVAASGLQLSNQNTITGGNGGAGGSSTTPFPSTIASGGNGAAAVTGNTFTLINDGSVIGGSGGSAGTTMMPTSGGSGGLGGAAVSGDDFVVLNNGIIRGGAAGSSSFMSAGAQGGVGISGSNFEVHNATGATISAGSSSSSLMVMPNGAPAIQSSGGSTVYNAGTITGGTGGIGLPSVSQAILFAGGNNTLVLENGSVIQGGVSAGSTDTLALGGASDSTFNVSALNSQYVGFGTFDKRDSSTWTLSGDSTGTSINQWNVKQGTLRTLNNTTLKGNVTVQQGAALQLGHTVIKGNLSNNGTLQLGHTTTPHTFVSVDGNFSQGSNGVYRIAAQSNDSEGGYSRLHASGNATLAGSAVVDVAQVNSLAIGQSLDSVVRAGGTLNGNFSKVTDNSALFDFKSVATNGTGGKVDLQVVQGKTIIDIIDPPTPGGNGGDDDEPAIRSNKPARGAAQTLDTIIGRGTQNAGMQQVITSLGKLSTAQQVSDAVSQTVPLLAGGSQAAAGAALSAVSDVVGARVSQGRGLSSGDEVLGEREVWVKTFGSWADQNERNGVSGFEVNSQGIIFGADAAISPQSRMGLAFAYANSDIDGDSKSAPNSADMDLFQLIGYGSYDLDDATQLSYQLDYGQGRTDGKRQILFMGTEAKAKYDTQIVHAGVALGHTLRLGEATELTPSVRADYTWVEDESYRETGAGALNLNVDRRNSESLVLGADAELVHLFSDRLSTRLKLGVGYDTLGERASLTSAYAGEPGLSFRTQGLDASPWLGRGGVGVSYRVTDSTELSADYDAEYREDFLNQSASLKVRWAF